LKTFPVRIKNLSRTVVTRRAVEIFTHQRHPSLRSAQETLAEIEKAMQNNEE
jgi:hypothetical protein